MIALVFALVLVLGLVSCSQNETISIDFPFEIEDVANIEMYHFEGTPGYVEKKVVVAENDIKTVYDMFERLSFTAKKAKETAGATTTSFRFNLADGTSYELTYICYGVKNGTLKSPTGNFEYFASADIGAVWSNIEATASTEAESQAEPAKPVLDLEWLEAACADGFYDPSTVTVLGGEWAYTADPNKFVVLATVNKTNKFDEYETADYIMVGVFGGEIELYHCLNQHSPYTRENALEAYGAIDDQRFPLE